MWILNDTPRFFSFRAVFSKILDDERQVAKITLKGISATLLLNSKYSQKITIECTNAYELADAFNVAG